MGRDGLGAPGIVRMGADSAASIVGEAGGGGSGNSGSSQSVSVCMGGGGNQWSPPLHDDRGRGFLCDLAGAVNCSQITDCLSGRGDKALHAGMPEDGVRASINQVNI